jgi:hypothetical protein
VLLLDPPAGVLLAQFDQRKRELGRERQEAKQRRMVRICMLAPMLHRPIADAQLVLGQEGPLGRGFRW